MIRAAALCATLLLFLPGAAYYLFLAVVLAWLEATAVRLRAISSA